MQVKDLIELLKTCPQDHEVTFLCPDGFEDFIENVFEIEDGNVQFLSYCHRARREAKP